MNIRTPASGSPVTSHESPVTNHQSPILHHELLITNHDSRFTTKGGRRPRVRQGDANPGPGGRNRSRGRSKFKFESSCDFGLRRRAHDQAAQPVQLLVRENQSRGCRSLFQASQPGHLANFSQLLFGQTQYVSGPALVDHFSPNSLVVHLIWPPHGLQLECPD